MDNKITISSCMLNCDVEILEIYDTISNDIYMLSINDKTKKHNNEIDNLAKDIVRQLVYNTTGTFTNNNILSMYDILEDYTYGYVGKIFLSKTLMSDKTQIIISNTN